MGKSMSVVLVSLSIVSLGISLAGGFTDFPLVARYGFYGFVVLLIFANLERISEFKASTSGIEAKTRDFISRAEITLEQLQELAKTVGGLLLSLVQRSGRWGAFSDQEKQAIYTSTIEVLKKIAVSEQELYQVAADWHRVIAFDYAHHILGGSRVPENVDAETRKEWDNMRHGGIEDFPNPADLHGFLLRHSLLSDSLSQLLQDYEYYVLHRRHRRPEVWSERAKWGHLTHP